jgi:predicted nucleic acid-binding protein
MKPTVYIETTIVSYLTAWPSRDMMRLIHESLTQKWWADERSSFDLCISQVVVDEISRGDPVAAADRLKAVEKIRLLPLNEDIARLAGELAKALAIPARAKSDAAHLAAAAFHEVSYLLTWNCRHLANAVFADRIEQTCQNAGYNAPRIVTPQQLLPAT